jgi:hypothetical protein
MSKQAPDDTYGDEETARRRDEVIKHMLNTPLQPRRPKPKDEGAEERQARKGRAHRPKPRP